MCSDVTPSACISTPSKLKNLPDHGGNRTRDLWFASSSHRGQADFSACPVWIYTQSNITTQVTEVLNVFKI